MKRIALGIVVSGLVGIGTLGGCGEKPTEPTRPNRSEEIALTSKGSCRVGMVLDKGESCTYRSGKYTLTFYVNGEKLGCRKGNKPSTTQLGGFTVTTSSMNWCVSYDIDKDEVFGTSFAAENNDGSWTILVVP